MDGRSFELDGENILFGWFKFSLGTHELLLDHQTRSRSFKYCVPKLISHRYTQVVEARHSGMDCRNPVTGRCIFELVRTFDQALTQREVTVHGTRFLHPCWNDGFFSSARLVYNNDI